MFTLSTYACLRFSIKNEIFEFNNIFRWCNQSHDDLHIEVVVIVMT